MFNRFGSASISPLWIKRIGIDPRKFLGVFVLGKSPISLFSDGENGLTLIQKLDLRKALPSKRRRWKEKSSER